MAGVADPALTALPNFVQAHLPVPVLPAVPAQPPPYRQDVRLGHQPVSREYPIAQKTDAILQAKNWLVRLPMGMARVR
jgi:hypothetical protein